MDDGSPSGYLITAAVLLLLGGWFAGVETSLASVSKIRMLSYADDGNKRAVRVLKILDDFDRALTTLLVGNNVMHLTCASLTTLFAQKMWGSYAVTAATLVTTLAVFFFSEMIPKSFAKTCSEKFALYSAGPLLLLMKLLTPLTWPFTRLIALLEKPLGVDDEEKEPTVTEDELKEIIESIDEEDEIDEDTGDLVKNAMAFSETQVTDVLTPWDQVVFLSTRMSRDEILRIHDEHRYSRYPVLSASGKLIGILQIRKYLRACAESARRVAVGPLTDRVQSVDVSMPIDDLLRKLSSSRVHLAVVRDAEKNPLGIVTVEDILEELVGEIYDETDEGGAKA